MGVDTVHSCAALLIGLLLAQDQPMAYLTALAIHHASAGCRDRGKTDARDATHTAVSSSQSQAHNMPLTCDSFDRSIDASVACSPECSVLDSSPSKPHQTIDTSAFFSAL
ncbi:hypothetical protein GCM10010431_74530 [Streptomyces kunmingensis]